MSEQKRKTIEEVRSAVKLYNKLAAEYGRKIIPMPVFNSIDYMVIKSIERVRDSILRKIDDLFIQK